MSKLFSVILCCCYLGSFVLAGKNSKGQASKNLDSRSSKVSCYDDIDKPYLYFSTKTSYRWTRNKDDDEVTIPGCIAQQFWLLSRHGSRNPGTKTMVQLQSLLPLVRNDIISNHKAGRGMLCKDDIENLEKWTFLANITDDKFLVKEGFKELEDIGDRFQDRFPKLLTKPFNNASYSFQHTGTERTDSSAKAFAEGLFGKKDVSNIIFKKSSTPDNLLQFYRTCDKWEKNVDKNPEAIAEKTLFEQSGEYLSVLKAVTDRLGFIPLLNSSVVDFMYTMCSFDKAWRPKKRSPWCAVFSEEDLKVLEYREDLEYYYEDGYGFPINYEQACMPLKDILDNFRGVVEGSTSNRKGIFYFTHSGSYLKVLARLGLFNDSLPLKHSNRHLMANREWRTSLISPFASNLAMVLFKCADGYRVTAYVQERPVKLPGCAGELCSFSDFSSHYGPIATTCSVDDICHI